MTTTLDAPPETITLDGPLAELAARCRRQPLRCVLLEARFRLPALAQDALDAPATAALEAACLQRLRSRLRGDDEVHPLGGFAFGLLLRRTGAAGAQVAAERLARVCSAPDWLGPQGLLLVLSVRRLVPPEVRGAS